MIDVFLKGGALMWPILLCSIVSVAIIIERFCSLHKAKKKIIIPRLYAEIKESLKKRRIKDALRLCEGERGPLMNVIYAGLKNRSLKFEERERIVSRVGSQEIRNLESRLNILSLIADISPLLGLTGTVTGLIKAFIKVQEAGGRVDASQLAGGIWEALITTAAGLFVAIPTLAAYHYFEKTVSLYAAMIKDSAGELLELAHIEEFGKDMDSGEPGDDRI